MMGIRNGVDVDKLKETIDIVKENPEIANFKFRSETEWIKGAHSKTRIQASSGKTFTLEADEPPILIGTGLAPNAVQAVLYALASCLTVGFVYNAAVRGINVDALELSIEGDLDLHAFLGISEDVRPGYQNIRVSFWVRSDATRDRIEDLLEYTQRTSPVTDIVQNGVPVHVTLERSSEAMGMRAGQAGEVSSSD